MEAPIGLTEKKTSLPDFSNQQAGRAGQYGYFIPSGLSFRIIRQGVMVTLNWITAPEANEELDF